MASSYSYTVKYLEANDQHNGAPVKVKFMSEFASRDSAREFAKNKLIELKDIVHKVTEGSQAKLVNNDSGKSIDCEDNCNTIIYSDISNNCENNWNSNYCWLNSDGSSSGGWISRHVSEIINWDFE